jgi:hypothetical protein
MGQRPLTNFDLRVHALIGHQLFRKPVITL